MEEEPEIEEEEPEIEEEIEGEETGAEGEKKEPPGMRRMRERMARLKHPRLRILEEGYYDQQKLRIATEGRLRMYEMLNVLTPLQAAKLQEIVSDMKADEKKYIDQIHDELKVIPVWQWLKTNKGIAAAMAGGIVAWIDDVRDTDDKGEKLCPRISSLWRYAGFNVVPYCPNCDTWFDFKWGADKEPKCRKCGGELVGMAPKRVRGRKAPWSWRLHTHMWKVVKQLLMAQSPKRGGGFYDTQYRKYKEYEVEKCGREGLRIVPSASLPTKGGKKYEPPGVISTGHVDNRAKRKLAKLFLAHVWLVWREMEGLPTSSPYSAKQGHRIISPPNWPLKEEKVGKLKKEKVEAKEKPENVEKPKEEMKAKPEKPKEEK